MDWGVKARKTAEEVMDTINDAYYTTQEAGCKEDPEQFIEMFMRYLATEIDRWQEEALDQFYADDMKEE